MARSITLTIVMLMATAALAEQEACAGDEKNCVVGNSMLVTRPEARHRKDSAASVRHMNSSNLTGDDEFWGEDLSPADLMKISQDMEVEQANEKELSYNMEKEEDLFIDNAQAHTYEQEEAQEGENLHMTASDAAQHASELSTKAANAQKEAIHSQFLMTKAKEQLGGAQNAEVVARDIFNHEKKREIELEVAVESKRKHAKKLAELAKKREFDMDRYRHRNQDAKDEVMRTEHIYEMSHVKLRRAQADLDEKDEVLMLANETLAEATAAVKEALKQLEDKKKETAVKRAETARRETQENIAIKESQMARQYYQQKAKLAIKFEEKKTHATAKAKASSRIGEELKEIALAKQEKALAMSPAHVTAAPTPAPAITAASGPAAVPLPPAAPV